MFRTERPQTEWIWGREKKEKKKIVEALCLELKDLKQS